MILYLAVLALDTLRLKRLPTLPWLLDVTFSVEPDGVFVEHVDFQEAYLHYALGSGWSTVVFHRPSCRIVKRYELKLWTEEAEYQFGSRPMTPCSICKPVINSMMPVTV